MIYNWRMEIMKDCHGQDWYVPREMHVSLPCPAAAVIIFEIFPLYLSLKHSICPSHSNSSSLLIILWFFKFLYPSFDLLCIIYLLPKSTRRAAIWLWCCKVSWLSRPVSCTLILNDLQDELRAGRLSPIDKMGKR